MSRFSFLAILAALISVLIHQAHSFEVTYIGCFTDGTGTDSNPYDLTGSMTTYSSTNTPTVCASYCAGQGYSAAGLQDGGECWCGNFFGKYGTVYGTSACNIACPGDSSKICGGSGKNSIYTIDGFLGCYQENPNIYYNCPVSIRDLNKAFSYISDAQTCISYCAGYLFASQQYGGECYCGNSFSRFGYSQSCSMPCDTGSQYCGGSYANSVYATAGPSSPPCLSTTTYYGFESPVVDSYGSASSSWNTDSGFQWDLTVIQGIVSASTPEGYQAGFFQTTNSATINSFIVCLSGLTVGQQYKIVYRYAVVNPSSATTSQSNSANAFWEITNSIGTDSSVNSQLLLGTINVQSTATSSPWPTYTSSPFLFTINRPWLRIRIEQLGTTDASNLAVLFDQISVQAV